MSKPTIEQDITYFLVDLRDQLKYSRDSEKACMNKGKSNDAAIWRKRAGTFDAVIFRLQNILKKEENRQEKFRKSLKGKPKELTKSLLKEYEHIR